MLIDVYRKPLIVFPEECPTSVVVRSVGNRTVSGLVGREGEQTLTPGASLKRGDSTIYETRLPLGGAPRLKGKRTAHHLPSGTKGYVIVVEPFEVASVYIDMLTGVNGTWRAGVKIEFLPEKLKRFPWVVSIVDVPTGITLSSVAVAILDTDTSTLYQDVLPLKKLAAEGEAPATAWSRILEDYDDDE